MPLFREFFARRRHDRTLRRWLTVPLVHQYWEEVQRGVGITRAVLALERSCTPDNYMDPPPPTRTAECPGV